jgi:histone acetyltransferase (RNA polymerase elongator complex component)
MNRVVVPFFISHQGCPHTCVFCDQRSISGAGGTLPAAEEIGARIRAWRDSAHGRPLEVAFFGGTFSALPRQVQQRLLAAVHPFLLSGDVEAIRISTRPDSLDAGNVQWLADQGVRTIELGVQSMDDAVLEASGRGHGASASLEAIQRIRENGLAVGAQLMPGLPGDIPATARSSLERVLDAGADFVRLYPVVVLRGTELARRYLEGAYRPLTLQEGVTVCKDLLRIALRRGTPVIRIGLQDDEGLRKGAILAGCWHPALGYLVQCELFFDLLLQLTASIPDKSQPVTVSCHPSRLSSVIGHRRGNLIRLRQGGVTVRRVHADPSLSLLECEVSAYPCSVRGSIAPAPAVARA